MPQRPKGFFPLFHFFLLSRLDFVQLPWKRSQFGKQVQILAQFLFIYRASYFSNCCQVKTVFNRRQVNMPIPFLGLSHPLSWGRGTMSCWVWPWLPEGWGPTQLRDVTRSDLGPCLYCLLGHLVEKQEVVSQRFQFWFGSLLTPWHVNVT